MGETRHRVVVVGGGLSATRALAGAPDGRSACRTTRWWSPPGPGTITFPQARAETTDGPPAG